MITTAGRVARNLILTGGAQIWSIGVSLVAVPIVVHGIGPSAYGVFVLAWLVVGYSGLFDLGLTPATIRAIAIQRALGDGDALQRTVSTAVIGLIGIAVPGGIALFLVAAVGSRFVLHLPRALGDDAVFVFGVVAAAFAYNTCMTIFVAVVMACQQFRIVARQSVLVSTATAVTQIALVRSGFGLRWLVVASFTIYAVSLFIFVGPARRLLPGTSFRPRMHAATLRALIGFGSQRIVSQLLFQLAYGVDRLVIAALLPISALTYYSVPLSITQKFVVMQTSIGQTFFPSASELHGIKSDQRLQDLYLDVIKLALVVTIPAAILVGGFAWPILDAWLGSQFAARSAGILTVLAIAYGLSALAIVPAQASDATGHVRWTMTFAGIAAAVTSLAAIILVAALGAVGGGIAVSVGIGVVGLCFTYIVQRRLLDLPLVRVLRHAIIRPVLAGSGLVVYCWLMSPRIRGVGEVLAALVLGLTVYASLTIITGTWSRREWRLLKTIIQSAIQKSAEQERPLTMTQP